MSYKNLDLSTDVGSIVSSINEVVSVSSSIFAFDVNTKKYDNIASSSTRLGGYWETCYDSSPTSSLSTALFDVSYGYATGSTYNVAATVSSSQTEKIKIYRHFARTLLGDSDSTFTISGSAQRDCFFVTFRRNIMKDEVKKGALTFIFNKQSSQVTGSDSGAVTAFKQALGGDYAPLKDEAGAERGQVWYNAGVVVLPADIAWGAVAFWSGAKSLINLQYSGSINELADGFRTHVDSISLQNQTNLHSTIYYCRAFNSEFNYSSNPTYVDADKRIRVTSGSNILQTRVYITTIGLYDANDNLLAVAKTNKPIAKSPEAEAVFRLRLDY